MYQPKPRSQPAESAPDTRFLRAETEDVPKDVPVPLTLQTPSQEWATTRVRTLVVDDDPLVREMFESILTEEGYETHCAASGAEALALLHQMTFDVMLCDIFMPEQSGLQLLEQIVATYVDMPIILVTGYGSVDLARNALHRGASDFITKPFPPSELPIVVERNLTRRVVQRRNMLRYRMALHTSNESVLDALLSALNSRDTETQGHSERVTAYTIEIADLMGVSIEELYHIERGALLHDIGKIGIPDRILLKPGKLTPEEWVEMRKHPLIGFQMCSRIEMLKEAAQIVLHHHEAWDGSGYPYGIKGEAIPLGARIFALADTLDAMTSDRPYRAALPFPAVQKEIRRCSGTQFDPAIVEVFLSIPEQRWLQIRALADK